MARSEGGLLEFRILGPLEVVDDLGTTLPLPSGRGRALLALLLLHFGRVVSTDRLIDELWGASPPPTAATALQGLVSRLRKLLKHPQQPDILETRSPGYVLVVRPDQIDSYRFRRLLKEAAGEQAPNRAELLRKALDSWRGPALADFTYQPFAQAEIAALEELRLHALEERIAADLELGRHGDLVAELEPLVAEHPLRERLREHLMLALYRSSRQAEALDTYRHLRRTLTEELGIEPGPTIQGLEGAILRQDRELDLSPHPPPKESEIVDAGWLPPGRKTVTVMFVDLQQVDAGFGGDLESRQQSVRRGYELTARALARHGATVEGLIGDVVVAIFGVPTAHEDDALRAVRAALDTRGELARLNEELSEGAMGLAARIGVNTGEVIVGGSELQHPAASGDTVNLAARLQQAAAQGEVLLGEETLRLVGPSVLVESLEISSLGEPAWRVLDLAADFPIPAFAAPMVGRAIELARLQGALEQVAESGEAAVMIVLGEAGMGKSRLVREFATGLGARALVLTGHCPSHGEGITFWPLREIVLQAGGGRGREAIAELLADEGDAEAIAAQVAAAAGLGEESGRPQDPFPAVRRFFEGLARQKPLVVVWEDLHWGQPTLLDLVDYLAGSASAPILMLCLARPEYLDQRRPWALGRDHGTKVVLEALGSEESEKLIATRLPARGLAPRVLAQLIDVAQGNPLFLEQMLAAVQEKGNLAPPPSMQALLAARLDLLGPAQRDLLRCASVAGMEFSMETLAALVPTQARPFLAGNLEALEGKALIRRSSQRAFNFGHVLIKNAAYRSVPRETRAELHERLAEWLDTDGGPGVTEFEELIGYHLEQACEDRHSLGIVDEHSRRLAIGAGQRLADTGFRAYRRFDAAAAENLLSRAKALLPQVHPQRSELLRQLAEIYQVLGRHHQAASVLDERLALVDDPVQQQAIRLEATKISLHLGPDPIPLASIEAEGQLALEVFEAEGDQAGMARALFVLVQVHLLRGDPTEMEKAARRSLVHADLSGETREELASRWMVARAVAIGLTPVPESIEQCEELVRWQGRQHPGVLSELSLLWAMAGDIDKGRRLVAQARELMVRELRVRRPLMFAASLSAAVETLAGDPEGAARELRLCLELATEFEERDVIAQEAANLSRVLSRQGDLVEAQRMASLSRATAPAEGVIAQALWRAATAGVLAKGRDPFEAERLARRAVEMVPAEMLNLAAKVRLDLAEVLAEGDRHLEARTVIDEAALLYERKGNVAGLNRTSSSRTG